MKYSDLQTIPKKFRIWDTFHKRWFQGGTSDQDRSLGTDAIDIFGEVTVFGALFHDQNCVKDSDDWKGISFIEMLKFLVCVQSTGIKDRNGREIFEGDIIVDHGYIVNGAYKLIGFVTTSKVAAGYTISSPMNRYSSTNLILSRVNQYEIIGNVFENPELLEGKNGK